MSNHSYLELFGVEENNLKSVDVKIKHGTFTAVSGVSGSGKSSLAFDTIYAEGGRRYIETFSPYTRQFLDRLHRPKVAHISGVRPALALEQRRSSTSSRSTVGTATEINDYLKLIWSQLSVIVCPACGAEIRNNTPSSLAQRFVEQLSSNPEDQLILGFRLKLNAETGKASAQALRETLLSMGFVRYFDSETNSVRKLEQAELETLAFQSERIQSDPQITEQQSDTLDASGPFIVIDRIKASKENSQRAMENLRRRIVSTATECFRYAHGALSTITIRGGSFKEESFKQGYVCVGCQSSYPLAKPGMFSFNSPLGACSACHGFGNILAINHDLIVPNRDLSISEGAISCWTGKAAGWERKLLASFCRRQGIDQKAPWNKLPKNTQRLIFEGEPGTDYFGIDGWFRWLETKRYKMHVRVFLSFYRSERRCPECAGTRLRQSALVYRINNLTLPMFWQLPVIKARDFFSTLISGCSEADVFYPSLLEVETRLDYLCRVGLPYLTLDRQMKTLSGGEAQRVNLTSLLGSRLCNTTIVLDEPTVGLHPNDTALLIDVIKGLREQGNTVVVVEHDQEILRASDEVIELGPLAGEQGGKVVFQGTPERLGNCEGSLSAKYLREALPFSFMQATEVNSPKIALNSAGPKGRTSKALSSEPQPDLVIIGAKAHNLKDLTVRIPLRKLVVLSGISGSGKSTLVEQCLHDVYSRIKRGERISEIVKSADAPVSGLEGLSEIDEIVLIDQTPLGKNPRANAATYTGAWELIRQALAETPDSQKLGFSPSHFSFNVDGGRCPNCKGAGALRVEMQFLSDVFVECEDCGGTRFQDRILTVRLGGKNVHELLATSLDDAVKLFDGLLEEKAARTLAERVAPLIKLGLGYLTLGQPLSELSGGEAQRVKLAAYLGAGRKTRVPESAKCLFILDEPTTGMHPHNVRELLGAFRELIAAGHSLLVIEHNLDLIAASDWLIDLGPAGGEQGGHIVVEGELLSLLKDKSACAKSRTVQAVKTRTAETGGASKQLTENRRSAERAPALKSARDRDESYRAEYLNRDDQQIHIVGARHHNLKNINVEIPKDLITCITGVSGSGKSTLAFDILFSEGQRRYIDCLSPYARQYIKQLERPEVDQVFSIPPTIAVSQKTAPPAGISTIATTTEVYQYLRLLYAKIGSQRCPKHHVTLSGSNAPALAEEILNNYADKRVHLLAPVVAGRKGNYQALFRRALRAEIGQAIVDGQVVTITDELRLERHKLHWVSLVVSSLKCVPHNRALLVQAIEQSLALSGGEVELVTEKLTGERKVFSTARVCPFCQTGFRELDPQDFSFRSARGVCGTCAGRGIIEKRGVSTICPECSGARIGEVGRNVFIDGRGIFDLTKLTAPEMRKELLSFSFPDRLRPVIDPIFSEIVHRLEVVADVGLGYLSLNRESDTLSGGEAQRLRLARTLGSPLSGVCYIFDEPTIGLHPQDHGQVMNILRKLRDDGNTVVVVEHDPETIASSDYVIDVGPGGGAEGGQIVGRGAPEDLLENPLSATGRALKARAEAGHSARGAVAIAKRKLEYLTVQGATTNNLKKLDVDFALGALNVVCGVSGAGKSSLVHGTLIPAINKAREKKKRTSVDTWTGISGYQAIGKVVEIDQSPLGRTTSSIPFSYLGVFDELRKLYAGLPEAKVRGWTAGYFSFNSGGGRCGECGGKGFVKVPMNFLPDAVAVCEACSGLRYHDQAMEITYQGCSIGELLKKTISQAKTILSAHARIYRMLDFVEQLGLGYLTLGQPTFTLSGGEAQRIKIARELGAQSGSSNLYILDEPTVGLHMLDVDKLLMMLRELVSRGNTVLVIEHDLEVISQAEHLIELGPEAGEKGGQLLFSGNPTRLRNKKKITPTSFFYNCSMAL